MLSEEYQLAEEKAASARPWYRRRGMAFSLIVLLPALLVLAYTALFAAPRYESRAGYIVRGMEREAAPAGGLAELVGAGAIPNAQREALAVQDYLLSLEAIDDLSARGVDLEEILYGPGADWFTTLRFSDRRAEEVRDYYQAMVDIDYDSAEGIATIAARAYSPGDALLLAENLIALGEEQVNTFNQRAIEAGEALAREQLDEAEAELASIQADLTNYRDLTGELDPSTIGRTAQQELEELEAELVLERAALASMRQELSNASPLVTSARSRVAALESAVAQLRSQLTGASDALNRRLSEYERLTLRQEFAAKRYEAAQAQLQEAQVQAARQRLFLVPVVTPNLPEKPVGPKPLRDTLVVLLGLALAFAIGWLLLAGVREHRAD